MKRFIMVCSVEANSGCLVARTIAGACGVDGVDQFSGLGTLETPEVTVYHQALPTEQASGERHFPNLLEIAEHQAQLGCRVSCVLVTRDGTISEYAKIERQSKTDQKTAAREVQAARRIFIDLLESKYEVFCLSYETLVLMGRQYLRQLYAFLDIESDYMPPIADGNKRFLEPFERYVLPYVVARNFDEATLISREPAKQKPNNRKEDSWDVSSEIVRDLARKRPCVFRGRETGPRECLTPSGYLSVKTYQCAQHGQCSVDQNVGLPTCVGCDKFTLAQGCQPTETRMVTGLQQRRDVLNGSVMRFANKKLLAYRCGWQHARIWLAELDDDFHPRWNRRLEIPLIDENRRGCEDPRLFVYKGQLHVAYAGIQPKGNDVVTHQMFCRLNDRLRAQENFFPQYRHRAAWEKNWQFFSFDDELYAVYMIQPHTVLRIDGELATGVQKISWPCLWKGGPLRGGASPVLVGDQFYCFVHDVNDQVKPRRYNMALYTFEAAPPFRVRRVVQTPLLAPDVYRRPRFDTPDCVYPCGAYMSGDRWIVSYGYFDHEVRIAQFDAQQIEDSLVEVSRK